jgi:eukaryotic-like serine/threonine-protein kinase
MRRPGPLARVGGAVPVGVALLATGLLVALLGFSPTLNPLDALLGRGAVVDVPDLSGRTQPVAEAQVRALGLEPEVRTVYSLTGRRGSVVGQEPVAGSRVREGSTVTLQVSRGANRVEMPDAVGRPLAEVAAALDEADVPVDVEQVPDDAPAGIVLAQEPAPGVVVTGEDRVRFRVSQGPEPRPVPEVAGLPLAGAAWELGRAGFVVESEDVPDTEVPEGAVVSTDPPAGEVVAKDATVTVTVSAGPPPVAVPTLTGRTQQEAVARLDQLGLVPNTISASGSLAGPAGAVQAQDPTPGTPLRPGQVVTLTVGGGGGGGGG